MHMQRRQKRSKVHCCDKCDEDSHHKVIYMSVSWGEMHLCKKCIRRFKEYHKSVWEPIWGPK